MVRLMIYLITLCAADCFANSIGSIAEDKPKKLWIADLYWTVGSLSKNDLLFDELL